MNNTYWQIVTGRGYVYGTYADEEKAVAYATALNLDYQTDDYRVIPRTFND